MQHQFTVFSVIEDDDTVRQKLAQCPNCGVIHKVIDITKSDIISGKDTSQAITQVADVKVSVPQNAAALLEANNADLPTWEAVRFIFDNEKWGEFVVLSSERDGDSRQGKYVQIMNKDVIRVETFSREEVTK